MFGDEGVYWIRNKSLSSKFIDIQSLVGVHTPYVGLIYLTPGDPVSRGTSFLYKCPSAGLACTGPLRSRRQRFSCLRGERWRSFIFRNYDTGTVLDIQNGSSTQGTPIIVQSYKYTGEDVSSQHWQVIWVSDDNRIPYYRITNRKTGTVLDQTRNTGSGADFRVESWNSRGGQHQLWSFERATFPTMYWLVNTSSQRRLQYIPNSSNITSLYSKTKFPSRNQLWYLESLVDYDSYYQIRHVDSEDRVLDLSGVDNTSILACTVNGGENQRWKITDVDMNGDDAVLYALPDREGEHHPRGATDVNAFNNRYQWRLIPCPVPSLFWTAVQCRGSGKFVAQSGSNITASDGARGEVDFTCLRTCTSYVALYWRVH
ncbi:ricin B lectin domain-containing protein [Pisolithus albus]|nr:ricin B lectin domain-containing protein [Pisolithus albus]